jgi:hypothetical protein
LLGLIRWLHPDVDVRLSPSEFEFAASGRKRSFSPVLYLSPPGTRHRVLAVGDTVTPASEHVRIELLNPASTPPSPWTREHALSAFFRVGLGEVLKRGLFCYPIVHLKSLSSIAGAFTGREERVFTGACRKAGAWEVLVC